MSMEEKIHMTHSEESGIGYRQKSIYKNKKNMNSFFLSVNFPRLRGKCRATRGDRGKCAYKKSISLFVTVLSQEREILFYFLSYELYLLCFIFCRASSASLKVIFLSGLWIRRERRIRLWSGASVFWKIASLCFCIHFSLVDA